MTTTTTRCQHCGADLTVAPGDGVRRCARCDAPHARHDHDPKKFPLTLKIHSGKTDELLWSRSVTLDEARQLAKIEIPGYARTEHHPVRTEVEYADGTTARR